MSGLEGRCCRPGLGGLGTVSGLEGRCCRLGLVLLATWKEGVVGSVWEDLAL